MFYLSEQKLTLTYLSDKNETSFEKPFFDQIFIAIKFVGVFLDSVTETLEHCDIVKGN